MRQLMNRTSLRRFNLIQFLYDEQDWVTKDSIIEFLGCSDTTFFKDIADLEIIFPDIKIINIQKMYRIKLNNDSDIQRVKQHFLAEIPIVQMVENMLYHPVNNLLEIAEASESSESTIYRLLSEFNQFLRKQYNIEIKGRPYTFEGSEADIRFFYYQYFSERFFFLEWPFPTIPEKALEEFLLYFIEAYDFPTNLSNFRSMKIILAVNLLRSKSGNHIEYIDDTFCEMFANDYEKPGFKKQAEFIKEHFDMTLDYQRIFDLFLNFKSTQFYFTYEDLKEAGKENEEIRSLLLDLKKMINLITGKFQLKLENPEEFIFTLYNSIYINRQNTTSNYLLTDRMQNICIKLQKKYPNFYTEVEKYATYFVKEYSPQDTDVLRNHLIFIIFNSWKQLIAQLNQKYQKIHILVISDIDDFHANTICGLADFYTSDNVACEILRTITPDLKLLEESKYDVILTNTHIDDLKDKEIIYYDDIMTDRVIIKLQAALFRVRHKRESTTP
ncbi:M protein trans-acting positive regulator PRD domain-containing protein [Fundicoccus sp. Sow4_H7]|uniref:M protein trans-acting positive regulator PRD domain-containing protein n=1 Tax=Fundicoccus sp. Sow4_H7 TaxID=3438784 RepID=UPI003F8DC78B